MDPYDECMSKYLHGDIVASMLWRRVLQGCAESGLTDAVFCGRPCGQHMKIIVDFIDSYFFDGNLKDIVGEIKARVHTGAAYFAGYDRYRKTIDVFPSFIRQYLRDKDIARVRVDGVAIASVTELYVRLIAHEIIHAVMGLSMYYAVDDSQDTTGYAHGPYFVRLNQAIYRSFPHRQFARNNHINGVRYH